MKRLSPDGLLWIDGLAALTVGLSLFPLRHWLAELFRLPVGLLTIQSGINLMYAAYSLSLARRKRRAAWTIRVLAAGNLLYSLAVVGLLWRYRDDYSPLGAAYFVSEIVVIGGLGLVEWRASRALRSVDIRFPCDRF